MFRNGGEFTQLQREIINKLARIEQEDAAACASCGGEDCACCEIYHDRQRWISSDVLFEEDLFEAGYYNKYAEYDDDQDEYEDCLSNMPCDNTGYCDPSCKRLYNGECNGR